MKKIIKKLPNQVPAIVKEKPDIGLIVLLACATAAILALAYYIIFPSRGYFHSDCTDTIFWAQASFDARAIFNKDYTYAALLPFGGSLLMLPWIGLFGVSMTTQTIGMLIFLALFVWSLVFLLRALGCNGKWIAATVAIWLPLLSLSDKTREIFWGHVIYYNLGLFFLFVGLGLLLRAWQHREAIDRNGRRKFWIYSGLLLLLFLLGSTNGFQTMLLFASPVIGAVFAQAYLNFHVRLEDRRNAQGNFLALSMLVSALAGLLLGLLLMGGIQSKYENGYTAFSDATTWFNNIGKFLLHWTQLMGVKVKEDDAFISVNGILNLIKLLASLVTLGVPLIMLFLYRKIEDQRIRILIIAHWVMSAAILFGYVFGVLASAGWRLAPILGSSLLLTLVFCKWVGERTRTKRLLVVTLLPLALAAVVSLAGIARMAPDYNQDRGLNAIKDFLVEKNLTYGYATFWNANAITVLSDSRVKIRSVTISDESIKPYYYQSQRRWFDDQPGQEQYFLLLTKGEFSEMPVSITILTGRAVEELNFQDYVVLVFKENIFPWKELPVSDMTGTKAFKPAR
jgi:hypothetical protein